MMSTSPVPPTPAGSNGQHRPAASGVPRRALGLYLRKLRQEAGYTVKAASTQMEWSEPKLWRIETAQTALRALDVQAMCALYAAQPTLARALADLARHTNAPGWWHSYHDDDSGRLDIYATLERAASTLQGYATWQVPALLRTGEYARVLLAASSPDPEEPDAGELDGLIGSGLARQKLITRPHDPLQATVILDETLLRTTVGGAAVMAAQLRHLADLASLPNVCLRVVPFTAGLHPGLLTGPFTLLDFPPTATPDASAPIVHTARLTGELFFDRPHEVKRYRDAHTAICTRAMNEAASRDLLCELAKELGQ
jgi:Domain of unknown function (DUF5753)/Helix-turn-helix domain